MLVGKWGYLELEENIQCSIEKSKEEKNMKVGAQILRSAGKVRYRVALGARLRFSRSLAKF